MTIIDIGKEKENEKKWARLGRRALKGVVISRRRSWSKEWGALLLEKCMTNHCWVYFTTPWGWARAHLSVHHPCVLAGSIYFIMSFVRPSRHTTCQLDTAQVSDPNLQTQFFSLPTIVFLQLYESQFHLILAYSWT